MKKNILILLSGIILLGLSGCGTNNLTGTYKISVINYSSIDNTKVEYKGTLKLFDSGTCIINQQTFIDGKENSTGNPEYNDCTYEVLDDTITFKYRFDYQTELYKTSECKIVNGNNFDCKDLVINAYNNELWEKTK